MAAKVFGLMYVAAFIASVIGKSPPLAGCGVHSNLMDMDAMHVGNYSHMTIIQLGPMIAGFYRSKY
jgi:hypothetical protein